MPVGNKGGILLVANIKRYTFTSTGLSFATLSTIYSHSSEKGNIEVHTFTSIRLPYILTVRFPLMKRLTGKNCISHKNGEILFCNTDTDTIFLWSGIRLYCIAFKINCNPIR